MILFKILYKFYCEVFHNTSLSFHLLESAKNTCMAINPSNAMPAMMPMMMNIVFILYESMYFEVL